MPCRSSHAHHHTRPHPLHLGAAPCIAQGVVRVVATDGESEVRPSNPSGVPRHRGRQVTKQVAAELRQGRHAAAASVHERGPDARTAGVALREQTHPTTAHDSPRRPTTAKLPAAQTPQPGVARGAADHSSGVGSSSGHIARSPGGASGTAVTVWASSGASSARSASGVRLRAPTLRGLERDDHDDRPGGGASPSVAPTVRRLLAVQLVFSDGGRRGLFGVIEAEPVAGGEHRLACGLAWCERAKPERRVL